MSDYFFLEKVLRCLLWTTTTLMGLVLFAIGISGLFGLRIEPLDAVSFIAQPIGLGPWVDMNYWFALTFVGCWLVLFVFIKPAIVAMLVLLLGKWLVLMAM